MAEKHVKGEVKEKRVRQEMTLERKIEILDQLKHVTNVSEFARENGLTRRNLYKLKKQEEKLRAAVASEPLTKPMRKRLNQVTVAQETKRQKRKESDMSRIFYSAQTVKLKDDATGSQVEVKPKLTIADSEEEITGKISDASQFIILLAANPNQPVVEVKTELVVCVCIKLFFGNSLWWLKIK